LCGDLPKSDVLTVAKLSGQEKKTPAFVHKVFKKKDLVDFVLHEAEVMDASMLPTLEKFSTPLHVLRNYKDVATNLVKSFRDDRATGGDEATSAVSLESNFVLLEILNS
jgi:hypothetical protein